MKNLDDEKLKGRMKMFKIFSLPRRVEVLVKDFKELSQRVGRIRKRNENKTEMLENQLREIQTKMNGFGTRIQALERNKKK